MLRMPYPVFDDVIHEPHRLRICAMLVPSAGTEFATERDEIGLSDSALSKHLKALSTRGYTRLERTVRDGRQVTTVVLTPPASRKTRLAHFSDSPVNRPASSTLNPSRTPPQNRRSSSRGILGRPLMATPRDRGVASLP